MLQFKKLYDDQCLDIKLGDQKISHKFDDKYVKKLKNQILSNNELVQLCKENIKVMRKLDNDNTTIKDWIVEVEKNPFCLFSECTSGMCVLTRTNGDNYLFRNLMETYIFTTFEKYWTKEQLQNNVVTYLSFGSGYFLQDIIILTNLYYAGLNNVNLILIANPEDYLDYVCDEKYNKLATKNLILPEFTDTENIRRKTYMELYTIRLNLFLDYLQTLGIGIKNTKIFANANDYISSVIKFKDETLLADLFIGIDHADERYNGNCFYVTATVGTKKGGLVFSLQKCMKCYPNICVHGEAYYRSQQHNQTICSKKELEQIVKDKKLCTSWKCLLDVEGCSKYILSLCYKIIPTKYIVYGAVGLASLIIAPILIWKYVF